MSLYSGTTSNALADHTDIFSKRIGLPKAQSEKLQADITEKLMALSEPLHLDPHELRDVETVILAHLLDGAQGKSTQAKTDRWADESMADLKTRHVSMTRARQVIHDCNAWLAAKYPDVHKALKNTKGLGNHPKIVRLLTDRFLASESETARAGRGAKWVGKARADKHVSDVQVPAGGLLAGNVGGVSAEAIKQLGKRPLAGPPDGG